MREHAKDIGSLYVSLSPLPKVQFLSSLSIRLLSLNKIPTYHLIIVNWSESTNTM